MCFGGLSCGLNSADQLVYGEGDRFALREDLLLGVWPLQGTLRARYPVIKLVNQENALVLHLLQLFLSLLRQNNFRLIAYEGQALGFDRRSDLQLTLANVSFLSSQVKWLSDIHRFCS